MKKLSSGLLILSFLLFSGAGMAEEKEYTTTQETESGVVVKTIHVVGTGSDDLAIGDPYGNRAPSTSALQGPKATWAAYSEDCQTSLCLRAKERQLSSPYWKKSQSAAE